jgi:hypothetical protein
MGKLRKNNKTFSSVWDAIANTPEQNRESSGASRNKASGLKRIFSRPRKKGERGSTKRKKSQRAGRSILPF